MKAITDESQYNKGIRKMKEWIKKNSISLVAIVISMVAIFRSTRFEPFLVTESALNWSLGIIVGIVGIAVSVALVTQIYTAMQIDKIMDEKIKKIDFKLNEAIKSMEIKSLNQATSTSMYVMGQVKAITKEYDNSLFSFLLAIKSAKAAGMHSFCEMYAEQALSFFKQMEQNGIKIYMHSKEKEMQISEISGVPGGEKTSALIRFIASLPETDGDV